MGEKLLSSSTVRGLLREKMRGRTVRAVAKEIGIAPSYLQAAIAGQKTLGEQIPRYFGLRPVVLYEWRRDKVREDESA